jgi:hypothetical protein
VEIIPALIAGEVQFTGPVPEHVQPAGGVAETNVTPAGNVSVTMFVVAVAWDGPRFFTCMEYVNAEETNTGVGETEMDIAMSELLAGSTRIEVTLVLLLGFESRLDDVTVAELTIVVPAATPAFTFILMTIELVEADPASAEL